MSECSDAARCLFDLETPDGAVGSVAQEGWFALRSRLTGKLVRMVDGSHIGFSSWDGIRQPRAVRKDSGVLSRHAADARAAESGARACPLRRVPDAAVSSSDDVGAADREQPSWRFNASRYAASVRRALLPWFDGELSATLIDMVFWHEMYPPNNRQEKPNLHISLTNGSLHYKWQPTSGELGGSPVPSSTDSQMLRMLAEVISLVELPDIELIAHTDTLPKVAAQNPEPVLSPTTDAAHNDIAVPSTHLWALADAATPECTSPPARRVAALFVAADCEVPLGGVHGPLWRFYPAFTALRIAAEQLPGRVRVELCDPWRQPSEPSLPIARAWRRKAQLEVAALVRAAEAAAVDAEGGALPTDACAFKWLLIIESRAPSGQLVQRLRQGFTVFKQESHLREHFSTLLQPWVHYVPVSENLEDVAQRVQWALAHEHEAAAIAARGQQLAQGLHRRELACFWWLLLTMFAPLQNFHSRSAPALGFKPWLSTSAKSS